MKLMAYAVSGRLEAMHMLPYSTKGTLLYCVGLNETCMQVSASYDEVIVLIFCHPVRDAISGHGRCQVSHKSSHKSDSFITAKYY